MRNLIILTDEHHRDREVSVGIKTAFNLLELELVAGVLHKSMINSRPSPKVSWYIACSACQSRQMLMPQIMFICYNSTRVVS